MMDKKLHAHINRMMASFARKVNERETTAPTRLSGMYRCICAAYERADSSEERAAWRELIERYGQKAEEMAAANKLKAKWDPGPGWEQFAKKWRS